MRGRVEVIVTPCKRNSPRAEPVTFMIQTQHLCLLLSFVDRLHHMMISCYITYCTNYVLTAIRKKYF